MARRPPLPRRRALCLGLAACVLATSAAPAIAATGAELRAAQRRIDRTSAELAQARSAADRLGGAERDALERVERRLQRQKQALLDLENGLEARHTEERVARAEAAAEAAAAADGAPVYLPAPVAPQPVGVDGYRADPVLNGGTTPPAATTVLSGDDAEVAARIDRYLAAKSSPLAGLGAVFTAEARSAGLDPRFLVAIAGAETSFATYGPSQPIHNPFGLGPGLVYPSWADAIRAAARNLAGELYAGDGRFTIVAIQQRWAPNGAANDPTGLNSHWTRNVSHYFAEQGGDPSRSVFVAREAEPTALPPDVAVPGAARATVARPVAYSAPAPVLGNSGRGPDVAREAVGQIGARSVRSGASPSTGFDAAGFVRWAYDRKGVILPRTAPDQAAAGAPVAAAALAAGDVLFFADPSGYIHHVGIHVGDGMFIQAPGEGTVVTISSLAEPYYAESYAGARRF